MVGLRLHGIQETSSTVAGRFPRSMTSRAVYSVSDVEINVRRLLSGRQAVHVGPGRHYVDEVGSSKRQVQDASSLMTCRVRLLLAVVADACPLHLIGSLPDTHR
jgi:hypothetical protein